MKKAFIPFACMLLASCDPVEELDVTNIQSKDSLIAEGIIYRQGTLMLEILEPDKKPDTLVLKAPADIIIDYFRSAWDQVVCDSFYFGDQYWLADNSYVISSCEPYVFSPYHTCSYPDSCNNTFTLQGQDTLVLNVTLSSEAHPEVKTLDYTIKWLARTPYKPDSWRRITER